MSKRTVRPPRSSRSPCASARGDRSARSLSETMQPISPWTTCAPGAAASHWFMAPHSSASTCPKPTQRRRSSATARAAASATDGNSPRMPVWNSIGSSASSRNWLNVNPPGSRSGKNVDSRNTRGPISVSVVRIAVLLSPLRTSRSDLDGRATGEAARHPDRSTSSSRGMTVAEDTFPTRFATTARSPATEPRFGSILRRSPAAPATCSRQRWSGARRAIPRAGRFSAIDQEEP